MSENTNEFEFDSSGIIDISRCEEFNTHLKSLSENSSSITLDFSATERLDTAAVQTLIAFLNHAGKNNKDVNIKGADGVVSDAFTRLGLDSCLKAHTG